MARSDYYKYDTEYQSTPEQKRNRAKRNRDRRKAIRDGRAKKGDGKDVHHIEGLDGPVRVVSRSKNRGIK